MARESRRSPRSRNNSYGVLTNWGWRANVEELEARLYLSSQSLNAFADFGTAGIGTPNTSPFSIPVDQLITTVSTLAIDTGDSNLFERAPGDAYQASFDDVIQGELDTCAFASVLAAVAVGNGPTLAGNIAITTDTASAAGLTGGPPPLSGYQVKLYKLNGQGSYSPVFINVSFDSLIQPEDLRPADDGEYWAAIFQRAYLQLADDLGQNYHTPSFALSTLTGKATDKVTTLNAGLTEARRIETALLAGNPIIAASIDSPNLLLDATYGIVHTHGYTVMGIEIPANGDLNQTFVTLRNPWGEDTSWEFFDADHSGALSWNEWVDTQYGIDGWNDGLIRIPWATFNTSFGSVSISQQTGPASNHPLKTNSPPVFSPAALGPYTIREGQRLQVNTHATDPDGMSLDYSLAPGCPGEIHLVDGTYVWTPPANTVGTYSVTVVATVSPFEKSSMTFQVNVTSGAPTIGSFTSNVNSIGDGGVDLLTLTANNLALPFTDPNESVDTIEFWQDADGNGTFNEDVDRFLGYGEKTGGNASWSGYIGSVTPGSTKFFTRAGWFSAADLHYSTVLSKSITITATPVVPPVATAGNSTLITPTTAGVDQIGFAIEPDAAGNLRTFWVDRKFVPTNPGIPNVGNDQYAVHTRLYDGNGVSQGAAQLLVNFPAPSAVYDAEVLPNGSFLIAWVEYVTFNNADIKARKFDSSGNAVGNTFNIVTGGAWAQNATLELASDSAGNLICVYNKGDYFDEDSFAVSVSSNNVVTRAPWQVNSSSVSQQKNPAVAMNASGNGVIVWNDGEAGKIRGRLVSNYGLTNGSVFDVATDSGIFDQIIDVGIDSNGNFIVSWEDGSVQARRFDSSGTPLGNAFRVNTNLAGGRSNGLVSMSDSGWSVIAWTSYTQDASGGTGVYAQLYDPTGAAAGSEFPVATLVNNQVVAAVYIDVDADTTFLWRDGLASGQGDDTSSIRQYTINLSPAFATTPTFSLAENSALDTIVGTVTAIDLDTPTGVTYSIVSGNLDNAFVINPATGQIRVADEEVLNFEDIASYDLVIRAVDPAGKSDLAKVTINLTDVNESPDLLDLVFFLQENSLAGTLVGDAAAAIDQDETDAIFYSLLPGDDASMFTINSITGQIFVGATATLNFETKPILTMTLKAADDAGLFETATVFINLSNRIEPPVVVPSGDPPVFSKKGGPAKLLSNVTLTGDTSSDQALRGSQLVVSINRASKKTKFFDTLTGFDAVSNIGTLQSQQEVGGRTVFTIQLGTAITTASVQSYLRGLSFSTTGAGLKLTTRLLKVQLIGTDGTSTNLVEQTITVKKK